MGFGFVTALFFLAIEAVVCAVALVVNRKRGVVWVSLLFGGVCQSLDAITELLRLAGWISGGWTKALLIVLFVSGAGSALLGCLEWVLRIGDYDADEVPLPLQG